MKAKRRWIIFPSLSLVGICAVLLAASAIFNRSLPVRSPVIETLSAADKIRLAESLHLREEVGNAVFPGWGEADIPVIIYNEEYAFLAGYPEPPAGWTKVPAEIQRGEVWKAVEGDFFEGETYYRQRLADPEITPEAFTVKVGKRWVASLDTLDWFQISLARQLRSDLPSLLQPVFPYRLFLSQLTGGSVKYISLIAHESFHSYQGSTNPAKFAEAELIARSANRYPWDDKSLQADWQKELDLLAQALRSNDEARIRELTCQFLASRDARRMAASLPTEMSDYEQRREWLEGLARYAELEIWRQASIGSYESLPETGGLDDFNGYGGFEKRWSQELYQIGQMADDPDDGRFYYTGMAQAYLLDRLLPDWKLKAFEDQVWLEGLLRRGCN